MMENSLLILAGTAVTIGFVHTLIGPDHYVPFIALGEARKWNTRKTILITFLCGIGHVFSSIILGFIGIAAGVSLTRIQFFESFRGNIAAWLLIAFGLVYTAVSIKKMYRRKTHTHAHAHTDGTVHEHNHNHLLAHTHIHSGKDQNVTPWILFLIFIFGPCEPLIPLVMYPAAKNDMTGVVIVSLLFAVATIGTMMAIVLLFRMGFRQINMKPVEKYTNVIAGFTILFSGLAIQFLGL